MQKMDWDDDEFEIKLPPGAQPAASALSAAPEKTWEDEVDRALAPEAVAAASASAPAKPEQVKAKHVSVREPADAAEWLPFILHSFHVMRRAR